MGLPKPDWRPPSLEDVTPKAPKLSRYNANLKRHAEEITALHNDQVKQARVEAALEAAKRIAPARAPAAPPPRPVAAPVPAAPPAPPAAPAAPVAPVAVPPPVVPSAAPVRAAAPKPKTVAPKPQAAPAAPKAALSEDDGFAIPDFLKRSKGEAPKPALAVEEAKPALAAVDDGKLSPLFAKGDRKSTAKAAIDTFMQQKGMKATDKVPDWMKASHATIKRIINEKFDTAEAIAKRVPGFDKDDFTSRYVQTRSHAGGNELKEMMKQRYPDFAKDFDELLSEKAFSTIYKHKTSSKDGTRKKR